MTFEEQIRREPDNRAVLPWLGQEQGAQGRGEEESR